MVSSPRILVLCSTLLLAGCGAEERQPVRIGDLAPAFTLPRLGGGELDSSALSGETVIVNFWATWCQPCRREMPVLKDLAAEGVQVVGIALDEEGEGAVRPFVERHGLDYTILLGNQEIFERFDGIAIPYTLVLDAERRIVNYYRGPVTREALEEDLGATSNDIAAGPSAKRAGA